ncbi:calcium-responsive transcription factor-like [Hydractinia symbiolongicarpus]|uniref:calcium-responsive transcription factor-like n=1 Tax=Hydractinia symbiolongicarpus TaxID=13093 RepID=UPI00254B6026|nr:calcium-responsive transcription factor-like [Hydractinia symbiolongicarpus]
MDCPAKIILRDIISFPDYKIDKLTEWKKKNCAKKLKNDWAANKSQVKTNRKIWIKILDCHADHLQGERGGISQQVDSRITTKIHALVGQGVRQVKEMERHIKIYVQNELFCDKMLPSPTNRRFFPTRRDITNHMYISTTKLRLSKIDQENLALKIEQWKKQAPTDNFFFRGCLEVILMHWKT